LVILPTKLVFVKGSHEVNKASLLYYLLIQGCIMI